MDQRTFYKTGIILGVITFLLYFLVMPVEGIVLGIVSLILNLLKRKEYRTLIGMIFTVLGLIGSVVSLGTGIYLQVTGAGSFDYWFFRLLFGANGL